MSSPMKTLQDWERYLVEISIEDYLRELVEAMPKYVFRLFDTGRLTFCCTEDGMLGWRFSDDVPRRVQVVASLRINKYTRKNPLEILGVEQGTMQ